MILPDVNLLLYATFDTFPEHTAARRFFEKALNGREEVGMTAPAAFGFLRLATNARIFERPLAVEPALRHIEAWLARPQVAWLVPGRRHVELAFGLMRQLGTAGNLTTDAQLAAYAIENRATLYSNDSDFGRFDGLDWVNPLE